MSETTQHYYKNSLLLEADIEEEMKSLQEEVERKEKTQDIMNLPKKIAYDCMVPLSKVAFSPGRMVHTNEVGSLIGHLSNFHDTSYINPPTSPRSYNLLFCILPQFSVQVDAESGARQWMSHVEAASHLQGEISRIQGDIDQLRSYLEARRSGGEGAVQNATTVTATATATVTSEEPPRKKVSSSSTSTSTSTTRGKTQKEKKDEEYVPFAEELAASSGGPESDEDEDEDEEEEDEAWINGQAGGDGGEGFEIREYCDKDGNILDGQIVDLSAELSQVQREQQQASKQHKAGPGESSSNSSSSGSGDPSGGVDNLVSDINQKLNAPNPAGPADELDVSKQTASFVFVHTICVRPALCWDVLFAF